MTELEHYIQGYFGIQEKHLQQIATMFELRPLEKGSYFTQTGQYCYKLSFVKSGCLRIYEYKDGKEITQWISTKGEFVTDLASLIFQQPARRNVIAMTDCELYTIDQEKYENIGTLIPQWKDLEKLFISKCFLTLEDRVFSFLSMSAEERYQQLFQNKPDLFNQVPLHYIASMLSMTPETLSRIRRKAIS